MIKISDLNFSYSGKPLFENLNLVIEKGFVYGLLGKNGAGKTTLLKIAAGVIFPSKGECLVFDEPSIKRLPETLKEIFFIPESFVLPEVSAEIYCKLNAFFYERFDNDIFYRKMEEFEIPKDAKISNLSFGQKKKFLLAFGIATNCKILIFDEPTNGLDIPSKRMVRNNIKAINSSGRIIIISTHNVKELESVFDNIIILERGKIVFNQSLTDIKEKFVVKNVCASEDLSNAIYYEEISEGGYVGLFENKNNEKGEIDLEFLFNSIISK